MFSDFKFQVSAVKMKRKRSRWTTWGGAMLVFLSMLSLLVSVAMPGVGWVMASTNILLGSILTPPVGRRFLGIAVAITVFHLFWLGPLSDVGSSPGLPLDFVILFIVVPMLSAGATMLAPICRAWKRRV